MDKKEHLTITVKAFRASQSSLHQIKFNNLLVIVTPMKFCSKNSDTNKKHKKESYFIRTIFRSVTISQVDLCSYITEHDLVISVFESKTNKLSTTHSWDFLGVDSTPSYNQMPLDSNSNVIVGVIDTGNYSFSSLSSV